MTDPKLGDSNRILLSIGLGLLVVSMAGCGKPSQLQPQNRRLLLALRTSVMSKNLDGVESIAKSIDAKRQSSEVNDAEAESLKSVIERARAGDWAGAKTQVDWIEKGQQPTAEDLERLKPGQRK